MFNFDPTNFTAEELEILFSLTAEQIAILAVFYGGQLAATIFAARTIFYGLGRTVGLSHPNHYRRFPRLPWRNFYRVYEGIKRWHERTFLIGKRPTGGFAPTLSMLTLLYQPGELLFGRAYSAGLGMLQPVGSNVKRHIFMAAQTGAGKTTLLTTQIAAWKGSVALFDPKAQVVNALAEHDKRKWLVFDPSNISDRKSVCFNVFDLLKEMVVRFGEGVATLWANRIAEALITTPSGARSPYFYEVSKKFLAGLILHVYSSHPVHEHNLPFVRDLIVHGYRIFEDGKELTKGDEAQALLLGNMAKNAAFGGVVAGGASAMISASGETAGNAQSTLQQQTAFLDLPNVRDIITKSDFSLSELKTRDDLVFAFTASIYSMNEELKGLTRLITNMIAYTYEAVQEKKGDCLFVVDELPSQGYNATIEVILATARSMGLLFYGITQSLELMQLHYPKSWKSFIGEADAVFWMGGNHGDNREYLAYLLGQRILVHRNPNTGEMSYETANVMEDEQIGRFLDDSGNMIVTRSGKRPLKLKNAPYYHDLPVYACAPNPAHKEQLLRRISRFFFDPHYKKLKAKYKARREEHKRVEEELAMMRAALWANPIASLNEIEKRTGI